MSLDIKVSISHYFLFCMSVTHLDTLYCMMGVFKLQPFILRNTQSYQPVLIVLPSNVDYQIVPDQYALDLRAGLVHLRGPIAALQSPTQSCGSFNQPNFYGFSFKTLQPTDRQSFGHRGDEKSSGIRRQKVTTSMNIKNSKKYKTHKIRKSRQEIQTS